eukprot:CAMPEP_0170148578 /NCGR_PEP_ID=MMETSP0033_2-20121228/39588_1 /TAXON_ID=195969 /ORGANISM="Dolichomastix tenuilepis, Strain CCMP3274" /LENGTH=169 /DNA_ID=CAMNT_0010385475 /DNA_START=8 /DNA_END=517 /DNA_ORIENTATION=-
MGIPTLIIKAGVSFIIFRSIMCKFEVPVMGCDTPACPVAFGQVADCQVTANSAEVLGWCEHGWTPWASELLAKMNIPYTVSCNANTSPTYLFAKMIGATYALGLAMMWFGPKKLGALVIAVVMAGAIHFHLTKMKDEPDKLVLQFSLFAASFFLVLADGNPKPKKIKSK